MTVLASGSKGNSTVVSSRTTRILVDAGLSCRELMKRMAAMGEDPHTLDAILITHEHADHVSGLPVLARKLGIPVYLTEQTHRAWMRQMTPRRTMTYAQWIEQRRAERALRDEEMVRQHAPAHTFAGRGGDADAPLENFIAGPVGMDLTPPMDLTEAAQENVFTTAFGAVDDGSETDGVEIDPALRKLTDELCEDAEPLRQSLREAPSYLPRVEYFQAGSRLMIGDIDLTPFTIPHDAADPCGFVFVADGVRIGFATDLGYMPQNVKMALRGCDLLMLESNHDLEMLRDGPYPWSVKQRVLSRVGHLSNNATAEFLTRDYDGGAQYIVLAHLSESNNMPELARMCAEEALCGHMRLLGNRLLLAPQNEPMETLTL